jgi:hypothetical protein
LNYFWHFITALNLPLTTNIHSPLTTAFLVSVTVSNALFPEPKTATLTEDVDSIKDGEVYEVELSDTNEKHKFDGRDLKSKQT